jgi:hypothetical protein
LSELVTFASRQPATYIKGTVFSEPITNSRDMLAEAHLDNWNVRLRPIVTDARSQTEAFEVIRDNPFDGGLDRFGVVGERYGTFQNEQAFAMFDDLSPEWEAAGAFRNGALVYGQAKVDKEIVIDPSGAGDVLRPMVVVSTTHNGSGALNIGRTTMRLDCLNMFQAMFGDLQHSIKVRHTLSIERRMKSIRLAWKQNDAYFSALEDEANRLFAQKCTEKQFWSIVDTLQGERPELNTKGAQTKWDNNRELFAQAWNGQPNEKVKGTRWGAYQALIERNQWGRKTQDTPNGVENFAMAGIGFDAATANFRQTALDLVRAI